MAIALARPNIDEREEAAVQRVLRSGWLTQGKEVAAFEAAFAHYVGATDAVALSNCTTALHLALLAVGVEPGDEVITVSHSFIATANAILYCRAVPVFVDIEPGTFNMDPARVEAAVTPRTRAILAVHQMGMPADMAALKVIADRHGLRLIEDAACAAGSEIRIDGQWQKAGRPVGDIACFSFHPRKILTCGEGGMITTNDPAVADACRRLRQHGMTVPDTARHAANQVIFESYDRVGYNYRMTDVQAAIGQVQLEKLPEIVSGRRAMAAKYRAALESVPSIVPPHEPEWARSNWQSFCVRAPGADQRAVMQSLLDQGIASRRGIMCSHREPAYANVLYRVGEGGLAQSEAAQDEAIILPLHHELTDGAIEAVVAALAAATSQPAALRA